MLASGVDEALWEWTGSGWSEIRGSAGVSPPTWENMQSVDGSGVLLFGGSELPNGPNTSNTWIWDGSRWHRILTAGFVTPTAVPARTPLGWILGGSRAPATSLPRDFVTVGALAAYHLVDKRRETHRAHPDHRQDSQAVPCHRCAHDGPGDRRLRSYQPPFARPERRLAADEPDDIVCHPDACLLLDPTALRLSDPAAAPGKLHRQPVDVRSEHWLGAAEH